MKKGLLKRVVSVFLALAMMFAAAGCAVPASAENTGGIVISEVVTSNSNSLKDPLFGQPDWVEIYNSADSPINLSGYTFSEGRNNTYTFPDIEIKPGEYLVVYCCAFAEGVETEALCTGFKLSKKGVTLTLSTPKETIQTLEVPELETDISWGLAADGTYKYFIPTPGAANTTRSFASLDELKTTEKVALKITEVQPEGITDSEPYGWVELYNDGAEPIELSSLYITENLSNPTKARMPDMLLEPGAYAVLRFTGQTGAGELPFSIGADEHTLAVTNSMGAIVDMISWDSDIVPGLSVGPGSDGKVAYYTQPTPGEANGGPALESGSFAESTGDLRINELLLKNTFSAIDEDGERSAWVELYNASTGPVDLGNYALSDNGNRLLKWRLPSRQVNAGEYVLVFLSGKDRTGAELHASFRLGAGETKLYLTQLNTGTFETADVPQDPQDNVSYGLSADGKWLYFPQPTPLAPNTTKGFAQISAAAGAASSGLMISEVAAVGTAKSGAMDWVEIYNGQDSDVDLSGYYLSDSRSNLKKWPIGPTTVKAGGYAVISKFSADGASGELGIRASGETLYLTGPTGVVLDQMPTGVLRPGLTWGVAGDGEDRKLALFTTPTPGAKNEGGTVSGYCAAPSFSVPGGYQSAPFTLEMSCTTEGAEIRYTTDGSTPTASSTLYTGPITISKPADREGVTVRAIAIAPGKLASDETVATYLFDEKHSLPVVCLSITKSDFQYVYSSVTRNQKYERPGYVEYYEADGTLGVRFPAGFRVAGASTRTYNQKSLNLYLRGGYGLSSVTYPFFGDYEIKTYKSLSLRNMGQDRALTCLRDAYFHTIANGLNILNMQSKFAAVYINGRYWGLYEFKENQNEDYLASKFGIDTEKVELVRSTKYAYVGTSAQINRLFDIAKASMGSETKWNEFMSLIDVDYFTDYLVFQTFICNSDYYNQKYTHTTDNKLTWRPMLFDLDWGLKGSNPRAIAWGFFSPEGITNMDEMGNVTSYIDTGLFYALYKNTGWRDKFVKRYAEVMNTTLSTERLLSIYDEMVEAIRDEMPRQIKRWGSPSSLSSWENEVKKLRKCLKERRTYVIQDLKKKFGLSDARVAELWPNG